MCCYSRRPAPLKNSSAQPAPDGASYTSFPPVRCLIPGTGYLGCPWMPLVSTLSRLSRMPSKRNATLSRLPMNPNNTVRLGRHLRWGTCGSWHQETNGYWFSLPGGDLSCVCHAAVPTTSRQTTMSLGVPVVPVRLKP